MYCTCWGAMDAAEGRLTLECVECGAERVRCARCGQIAWWAASARTSAFQAAEAHRWETGHARVVVRTSANLILREALDLPIAGHARPQDAW